MGSEARASCFLILEYRWPREVIGIWDLRSRREKLETLALDSGLPARLVFLPAINFLE